MGFEIHPLQRVHRLWIAEQRRVEIVKVLLAGARILILDEPTAVLTDSEAERLLQTVRKLAHGGTSGATAGGAAVILVTHKMADVRTYADRVTVMRAGRTVSTLDPKATPSAELVRMIVGDTVASPQRSALQPGDVVLNFKDLKIRAGEIYGLAGVGGNGQSELAEEIINLNKKSMAAIPADRYGIALAGALSVAENFGIGGALAGRYGTALAPQRPEIVSQGPGAGCGVQRP